MILLKNIQFKIKLIIQVTVRDMTTRTFSSLIYGILISLFILATHQQTMTEVMTYGSLIKLQQPSSGKWLHSHEVRFGRGAIFSVTGYVHDDLGNYWQILEQFPYATKTYSEPIKCGDVVRIKSSIIGYNLRVDETSFGLTTELLPMVHGMPDDRADAAVNWKIKCVQKDVGEIINFGDQIKLKHSVTGKYIILDPSSEYTEFNCRGCQIISQIEIHGVENDSEDEKTTFKILGGLTFSGQSKEE